MMSHDITGLVIGGSTGEGQTLTAEETGLMVKTVVDEVKGKLPVMAGILAVTTHEAVQRANAARDAGAGALMVTPPIYQVPNLQGLKEFYARIHRECGLPIITYNVLARQPITPEYTKALVADPACGLIGQKESLGGSLETLCEILQTVGDKIAVTWAHDWLLFPGLAIGAVGSISGASAVLPQHTIDMFNAVRKGDIRTAQRLNFIITNMSKAIGYDNWTSGMKAAINAQGRRVGKARSPFVPVSEEQQARIEAALKLANAGDNAKNAA
jgi:4-hydroxy-tetrahydrodipicolinate synthase